MVLNKNHANYEAAKKSLQRVMEAFAPKAKSGKPTANKADAVKVLLTRYQALSRAEKARFLAAI
jgi:hypothetical protein